MRLFRPAIPLRLSRLACGVFLCALMAAGTASPADAAPHSEPVHAGYRTLSSSIPSERLMVHMGVWYPTARKPGTVKLGDWSFRAARNAPALSGPWPVIILSHDVTGSAWAHHDLAAALASRGYIVAAPTHDHSHAEDMSLFLTKDELPLRAVQAKAALDLVLANPKIGPMADASRVGFVGFGTPSASGLLLAGGAMDTSGWPAFCGTAAQSASAPVSRDPSQMIPDDASGSTPNTADNGPGTDVSATRSGASSSTATDSRKDLEAAFPETSPALQPQSPWCTPVLRARLDALVSSLEQARKERAGKVSRKAAADASREQAFRRLSEAVERSHQRQMRLAKTAGLPVPPVMLPLLPPLSEERTPTDERFRALAFVSPGLSMLFSRESLSGVRAPSLFIGAEKERWNLPAEQAERFASMLDGRARFILLPEADGPSFQAACPASDPALPLDALCRSVTPEARNRIHARLVRELDDFFSSMLRP